MEKIWTLSDPTDLIIALSGHLDKKCHYGENMAALSHPERIFYITQTLEMEVNNGGFGQFFYNSSGSLSGELVAAFTEIGANRTAELCQRAISAFGREIPIDRDKRQDMLDECDCEEVDAILNECDDAFYEYEDDLETLNYQYVLENKAAFI